MRNIFFDDISQKIKYHEEATRKTQNKQEYEISQIKEKQLIDISRLEEQKSPKEMTANASEKYHPFTSEINPPKDGILCRLKKNEKSPFKHLFVASQSSNDIYNLIDPNTNDDSQICNIGGFIEIELQEPVDITRIKIFSSNNIFPIKFDIEIKDKLIQNIKEAKELKRKKQSMTIEVEYNQTRKIRIINRGKNWDTGNNNTNIKSIELLSNDAQYLRGFFSTLVYESEDHDPHKCPVIMSASNIDLNTFHLIDSLNIVCTYSKEHSWFQIEFAERRAVLSGFRLKKCNEGKLKSYKIKMYLIY
ncbi:hypothetical protein M9Y10_029892 [Tritrichomonas musculus]|uniref:Uncharacterized protein n=1 Tax=Tritrichomonas musculus TaxID=1915356 RepID=A0ABR2KP83_9EUKA